MEDSILRGCWPSDAAWASVLSLELGLLGGKQAQQARDFAEDLMVGDFRRKTCSLSPLPPKPYPVVAAPVD